MAERPKAVIRVRGTFCRHLSTAIAVAGVALMAGMLLEHHGGVLGGLAGLLFGQPVSD